jgi:hypothetical protein
MQRCPPHGSGERPFWRRLSARIFYLTIALLLPFLANCNNSQRSSNLPTEPPTPPAIREFVLKGPNMRPSISVSKDLEKDRAALETYRMQLEKAKGSNSIKESEYKEGIKKYEQRTKKNKEVSEKLKLGN